MSWNTKKRGPYKAYLMPNSTGSEGTEARDAADDGQRQRAKIPRQTISNWRHCEHPKGICEHSTDHQQHGNLNNRSTCSYHPLRVGAFEEVGVSNNSTPLDQDDEMPFDNKDEALSEQEYHIPPQHEDRTPSDHEGDTPSDNDGGTHHDKDDDMLSDKENGAHSDQEYVVPSEHEDRTPSDHEGDTPSDNYGGTHHDKDDDMLSDKENGAHSDQEYGVPSDLEDRSPSDHAEDTPTDNDDGMQHDQDDDMLSDKENGAHSDQEYDIPSDHEDRTPSDHAEDTPSDNDDGMQHDQDDDMSSYEEDELQSDHSDDNIFDILDQDDRDANDDEPNEEPCPDDEPFYQGSSVTLRAAVLVVMAFILAHHLTSEAVEDLLKLMGLLLPISSTLPRTSYFLKKYFKEHTSKSTFFVYCPQCQSFLGSDDIVTCQNCNKQFRKKVLIENGNYFITMSIREQLEKILENDDLKQLISFKRNDPGLVSDIRDGEMYKRQQQHSFSLNMNCDGLPIFKSAVSLWPIQLVLNELPPKHRKNNIILAGLWFGPTKPSMFTFLKPFTEEMQNLSENGIQWKNGDRIVTTNVFLSLCALDSVARCQIANMKQFNGEYGCGLCLNKGERVPKGNGYVRIYNHNDVNEQKRTDEQVKRHAADAYTLGDDVFGVKGPSPLFNVPKFDVVEGFPPDPLHAVDLGVCRQVGSLWFDSVHHNEEWYIGGSKQEMDRRMTSFHPPTEVTRTPHPVSDHVHWKGSEWRSWLLYCIDAQWRQCIVLVPYSFSVFFLFFFFFFHKKPFI